MKLLPNPFWNPWSIPIAFICSAIATGTFLSLVRDLNLKKEHLVLMLQGSGVLAGGLLFLSFAYGFIDIWSFTSLGIGGLLGFILFVCRAPWYWWVACVVIALVEPLILVW